ncbi:MAG: CsgE family curli-type amyloid fiber assembly protein [Syntrophothermus sp.]
MMENIHSQELAGRESGNRKSRKELQLRENVSGSGKSLNSLYKRDKHYGDYSSLLRNWDTLDYKFYFVKEGDCLWKIAGIFRNSFLWPVIFEANKAIIADPQKIFPHQRIKIPGVILSMLNDTSIVGNYDLADPDTLSPEKKPDELGNVSEDKSILPATSDFLNIDGIIVDETITKIGRDFYEMFYNNWEAPEGAKSYSIFISEKPQPRLMTLITIRINDYEIFQEFLHPRYNIIEENVSAALEQCTAFLQDYEEIVKELEAHELKGSGIY